MTETLSSLAEARDAFRDDLKWNCEQLFLAMMRESGIDTTKEVVIQFGIALAEMATDHLCEELDKFNEDVTEATEAKMRNFAEYNGFDWETFKSAIDTDSTAVV